MEPQLNLELIKMYYRATGQGTSIYVSLVKEYLNNLDQQDIESLPTIAPLLLAMVAVCHYDTTHSVTMYQAEDTIVATFFVVGEEMLTLSFADNWLSVKYPEYGLSISTKGMDIENDIIPHIVADVGMWNMSPSRIKVVVDYLMAIQKLINPLNLVDVLDIFENERQDMLDTVSTFDKIIELYTVKDISDDGDDLTYTDEQYEHTVTQQYETHDTEGGLTTEQLPENINIKQVLTDSIDSELSKVFLEEFSEIADIVKIQTSSLVNVFFEGRHTLRLIHSGGVDEIAWTLVAKPDCPVGVYFMQPTTSDVVDIHNLDMASRDTMIKSFADVIEANTGGIVHDSYGVNKVVIDEFIKIVLNIMESGVSPKDVHLPSEEPQTDPEEPVNDKIRKLAAEYVNDIGIEFNENKHVKILDSIGYLAHRLNAPSDFKPDDSKSFVDLISRAYAADLTHNSRIHNSNTLKSFVQVYVNSLVSINWEPRVLKTLDPSVFRNRPNWVTSYGFDTIVEAITKYWYPHEQLNIGFVTGDSNLIIPTSNATTDIRNHLNSNQVLGDVPHGVTKLAHTSDDGKVVTNYRYIRIPSHKDHDGGDTLVVYIEMTSDRIRIVPIYTDSKTNKVDSLNVFVSIRETDWPNILLYLDMILNQTSRDTDSDK